MSNRIVPATYRSVIDDVMTNIRDHFLEFGIDDSVLQTLQNKWEQKVVDSNVAEFEPGPPAHHAAASTHPPQPLQPLHPQPPPPPAPTQQFNLAVPHQRPYSNSPGPSANFAAYSQNIKPEPQEALPYSLPSLAAPGAPQGLPRPMMLGPGGQPMTPQQMQAIHHTFQLQNLQANLQRQALMQQQQQQAQHSQTKPSPGQLAAAARLPQVDGPSTLPTLPISSSSRQIPQLDGPSSASDSDSERDSPSPPPPAISTHTLTSMAGSSSAAPRPGDEEIGSDLDDDDSENDDEEAGVVGGGADGAGPGDIVYCTYDKVQRVKNKWKCVLKDGIVSIGGKDYLFSKCSGEFEW